MGKYELVELARALTDTDWAILQSLRDKGAATATDVAVRLRAMPNDVLPDLKTIVNKGLVEVEPIAGTFDREVYRVSDTGHAVLRIHLPHLV
jgi:DNA-binding MarR family transcriptional regulator